MLISSVGYGLGVGYPAGWAAGRWGTGAVMPGVIAGGLALLAAGLVWGVLDGHPGVGGLVVLAVTVAVSIAVRRADA